MFQIRNDYFIIFADEVAYGIGYEVDSLRGSLCENNFVIFFSVDEFLDFLPRVFHFLGCLLA